MAKLKKRIIYTCKLEVITGLHIGGSKSIMEIGGVDLPIIKSGDGKPYIPGSSLKGKIRSLLAMVEGSEEVNNDSEKLKTLFGYSGIGSNRGGITRLYVRDSPLDLEHFENSFDAAYLEMPYSEIKTENTIIRASGTASNPRQIERVPSGSRFDVEMVLSIYDTDNENQLVNTLKLGMELLEDDYLGGSGSRGYGKIKWVDVQTKDKLVSE